VIGNGQLVKSLDARIYTDEIFSLPTVKDILKERDI